MKSVLIITQKSDPHADAVIRELERLKCKVLRVNTETFLNSYQLDLGFDKNFDAYGFLSDNFDRSVDLNKLIGAYYRKPIDVVAHSDISIEGAKEFSIREGEEMLKFLYTFPNLKWVNDPFSIRKSQVKFGQLQTAYNLGLKIPRTIITNKPNEARNFIKELNENVLCKSLQTTFVKVNNIPVHSFAHRLSKHELKEQIDKVRFAPTLFQEYIEKKIELRINVIGNKVFATEIDSQSLEITKFDWRKTNPWDIPHRPYELPPKLEKQLIAFVKHYSLSFGAIDMIKTPNDDYVFLENNPNGQWYWIEMITKQPLAQNIAELLISNNQ